MLRVYRIVFRAWHGTDLSPGRGLPMSTSRSMWVWRDRAPTLLSPAGRFAVKVWVWILVLELGLGVYFLNTGFSVLRFGSQVLLFGGTSARACASGGKI